MKTGVRSARRGWIVTVALLLLLALAFPAANAYARYRTQSIIANEVHYRNRLASGFKLLDRKVIQKDDGTYELSANEEDTVAGNSYYLIPGTVLPADPTIVITGKTDIPAFLYLEVVNSSELTLQFLSSDWNLMKGVEGKNHGLVYSYQMKPLKGEGEGSDLTIKLFTSGKLAEVSSTNGGELKLYAYLVQQTDEAQTAQTAFTAEIPQS